MLPLEVAIGKDIIQLLKMLLKSEQCFETTQPIILNPKGGVPGSRLSPLISKNRKGGWHARLDDILGSLPSANGKDTASLLFPHLLSDRCEGLYNVTSCPHMLLATAQTLLRLGAY